MPDARILSTEDMVGATHPTLPDTLNRLALIDHQNSGAHKAITYDDWTNRDGASLSAKTVVIQDTANAKSFKRTTTQGATQQVSVVMETIANLASGRIARLGPVTLLVQGNVAIGETMRTSTTNGRAESTGGSTLAKGSFAVARTAYTGGGAGEVEADLFGFTQQDALESGTWSDATASRSFGTIVQNTSGKMRRVIARVTGAAAAKAGLTFYVGSANPPTMQIGSQNVRSDAAASSSHSLQAFFLVPASWYYKMDRVEGTESLNAVYEADE